MLIVRKLSIVANRIAIYTPVDMPLINVLHFQVNTSLYLRILSNQSNVYVTKCDVLTEVYHSCIYTKKKAIEQLITSHDIIESVHVYITQCDDLTEEIHPHI